jgi:hypothetical protein
VWKDYELRQGLIGEQFFSILPKEVDFGNSWICSFISLHKQEWDVTY